MAVNIEQLSEELTRLCKAVVNLANASREGFEKLKSRIEAIEQWQEAEDDYKREMMDQREPD